MSRFTENHAPDRWHRFIEAEAEEVLAPFACTSWTSCQD